MADSELERLLRLTNYSAIKLLFVLRNANMQATTDQPFSVMNAVGNYMPTHVVARQRSGGASVVCAGGIYDGAAKTGNIIVPAATSWVSLAAAVPVAVAAANILQTALLSATPILSLTTGSTAACTSDLYLYGLDIS